MILGAQTADISGRDGEVLKRNLTLTVPVAIVVRVFVFLVSGLWEILYLQK